MRRDRNGLEILARADCLQLLASRPVGRVALTRNALPAIYPVTYALVGEHVVFATGAGSSYLAPIKDAVIAFEVDDVDPVTRSGWSVLVVGVALRVSLRDMQSGTAFDLRPWVGPHAVHVIRLGTDHLSGRRLSGHLAIAG